jgi:hypothetical protein
LQIFNKNTEIQTCILVIHALKIVIFEVREVLVLHFDVKRVQINNYNKSLERKVALIKS